MFNKGDGFENNKTFTLSISIKDNKEFVYKVIPMIIKNDVMYINDDESYLKELYNKVDLLKDDNKYIDVLNSNTLQYYEKVYKKLYYKVAGIYKGGLKEKAKQLIKKYILREKFQDKVLYHNLNIETHYWIARRASRLIMKQKNII